ncbi:hypothetical protein HNP55_001615 [Paucibacter oligotrophus]|uniref:Protein kinase domain-containing protein n=1 Tax=Roseateles oligotrophus TaxID=1769250 RepID=A0A840L516_9BURK|nr:hypothetical protein [Roseateles oligotrophus]MBB4843096.1 hypothetical protein [Roseateles oligotrophus]
MPELALPPPAATALLSEGTALGVWRLRAALQGVGSEPGTPAGQAVQAAQWYEARHVLAADQFGAVLVLPRSERAMGAILRFGDLAADFEAFQHPALCMPTDSGVTAQGHPYLIFEGVAGQPLLRAAAALALRERLSLVLQLCEALGSAHRQGWQWAEIDPAMLWLGRDRKLKLMALGLLRMPDPISPLEHVMGLSSAPGYASPEIEAGESPSLRSEVFGVGVLLRALVEGCAQSPSRPEAAPSLQELSPAASWAALNTAQRFSLDALIHKAVAPQAERRYSSVEALAQDLRAWLAGESMSALRLQPMPEPQGRLMTPRAARQWSGGSAHWGGRAVAASVLLCGLMLLGLWLERDVLRGLWVKLGAGEASARVQTRPAAPIQAEPRQPRQIGHDEDLPQLLPSLAALPAPAASGLSKPQPPPYRPKPRPPLPAAVSEPQQQARAEPLEPVNGNAADEQGL